ncbi:MAG: DUF5320 domain-containing protein [Deltaproteobacteria bacterium]|nr:DUF5320 domain-containing protein [Candidatus Anaeroferrophillacea bacterium]
MPRFDGSGPMGAGPMTGRGMGNCRPAGRSFLGGWNFGFGRQQPGYGNAPGGYSRFGFGRFNFGRFGFGRSGGSGFSGFGRGRGAGGRGGWSRW